MSRTADQLPAGTPGTVTVTWTVEDAAIVHALLTNRIDTYSNWTRDALLRDDTERAKRLAGEAEHLVTVVRAQLRGASMNVTGALEVMEQAR